MIKCTFENGNQDNLRHVVVGVIIVKDGKVLLAKRGTFQGRPMLEYGKWGLPGGFLDRGETTGEGCMREVMEELGLRICNLKLIHIVDIPNRRNDEDRQNVNFVYIAELGKSTFVENEEVSEVKWFDINNLPPKEEIAFDFYGELIFYKKYLNEKILTPVLN
jgi:8-oxo-dGTP diphosphatase